MLNGLQRRYTLEQIEAQDEALIVPRLNYNALKTLRSPLYKKLGQQVTDTSKEQHDARLAHNQTSQTIGSIANHNGVNAAELEDILRRFAASFGQPPGSPRRDNDDDDDMDGGGDNGPPENDDSNFNDRSNFFDRRPPSDRRNTGKRYFDMSKDQSTLDSGKQAAAVPNNEMYRINLELNAANQVLRQEADMKARQDTARWSDLGLGLFRFNEPFKN